MLAVTKCKSPKIYTIKFWKSICSRCLAHILVVYYVLGLRCGSIWSSQFLIFKKMRIKYVWCLWFCMKRPLNTYVHWFSRYRDDIYLFVTIWVNLTLNFCGIFKWKKKEAQKKKNLSLIMNHWVEVIVPAKIRNENKKKFSCLFRCCLHFTSIF